MYLRVFKNKFKAKQFFLFSQTEASLASMYTYRTIVSLANDDNM